VYPVTDEVHVYVYDDGNHMDHCKARAPTPLPVGALVEAATKHEGRLTASHAKVSLAYDQLVNEFSHRVSGGDIGKLRKVLDSYHDGNDGEQWKYHLKKHQSKQQETNMAQVLSMSWHMDQEGTKVLWYNGERNHPGTRYEFLFMCIADLGASKNRKPLGLRNKFSMAECLVQCMKGGRYYDMGLHVDATYGKVAGWELIDVTTYDPDLGRIVELGFMLVRVHDGIGWNGKSNHFVWETLFDCLFNTVQEYMANTNMVVRFSLVIADCAGEITVGQTQSWHRHSKEEYPLDPKDPTTLAGQRIRYDSYHRDKSFGELAKQMPSGQQQDEMLATLHKLVKSKTMIETSKTVEKLYTQLRLVVDSDPSLADKVIRALAWHARRAKGLFGSQFQVGINDHSMCESNHNLMVQGFNMNGQCLLRGWRTLILLGLDCESGLRSAAKYGTVRESITVQLQRLKDAGGMQQDCGQAYAMELVLERKGDGMMDKPLVDLFTGFGQTAGQAPSIDPDDNHSYSHAHDTSAQQAQMQEHVELAIRYKKNLGGKLCNALLLPVTAWPPRDFTERDRMLKSGVKVVRVKEPSQGDKHVATHMQRLVNSKKAPKILEDSGPLNLTHGDMVESLRQKGVITRTLLVVEHGGRKCQVYLNMWPHCDACELGLPVCIHLRWVYNQLMSTDMDPNQSKHKWTVQKQLSSKEARALLKTGIPEGVQSWSPPNTTASHSTVHGVAVRGTGRGGPTQHRGTAVYGKDGRSGGGTQPTSLRSSSSKPEDSGQSNRRQQEGDGGDMGGPSPTQPMGACNGELQVGGHVYYRLNRAGPWAKGVVVETTPTGQVLVQGVGGGGKSTQWMCNDELVRVTVHSDSKEATVRDGRVDYEAIVAELLPGLEGQTIKQFHEMLYDPTEGGVALTLNVGGHVVGGCTFQRWYWPDEVALGLITSLAVSNGAARRCGLGRLLVELVKGAIPPGPSGVGHAWLYAHADPSTESAAFWASMGLETVADNTISRIRNIIQGACVLTDGHHVCCQLGGGQTCLAIDGLPPMLVGEMPPLEQGTSVQAWRVNEQQWKDATVVQLCARGRVLVRYTKQGPRNRCAPHKRGYMCTSHCAPQRTGQTWRARGGEFASRFCEAMFGRCCSRGECW
jgi:hypothetical protein